MTLRIRNMCSKSLLFVRIFLFLFARNGVHSLKSLSRLMECSNVHFVVDKQEHVQCLTWELWNPVFFFFWTESTEPESKEKKIELNLWRTKHKEGKTKPQNWWNVSFTTQNGLHGIPRKENGKKELRRNRTIVDGNPKKKSYEVHWNTENTMFSFHFVFFLPFFFSLFLSTRTSELEWADVPLCTLHSHAIHRYKFR